jgi:DNA-binding CsgD family transcriptional regulator
MGQLLDLQEARRRLGLALDVLCHDRWVVGFLRGGSLQPIAASEISRRLLQSRPLLPLSRRALYEQRPVVVNSVFPYTNPASSFDWELDWPAIMYAPVGEAQQRPIGLLVLGCRRDYWYSDDDVQYAAGIGIALAPLVASLRGPLGRMSESELEVAQLLSCGMSAAEIGRALNSDETHAQGLVSSVKRKLHLRVQRSFPVCVW